MAKSPSEQIREMTFQLGILTERDATRQREVAKLSDDLVKERETRAALHVELTALKQQLQDHIKHTELSDSRRWTLIIARLGAALSLASGLIVTLTRK